MEIVELRKRISDANEAYRKGHEIISDVEYDQLIDELKELNPHDPLLSTIGYLDQEDSRKQPLPIPMASMNKVKTYEELVKWANSKKVDLNSDLILTPKYDGASLCVHEEKNGAWTRGDGIVGQKSDDHFKLIEGSNLKKNRHGYSFGEVIMSKKNWTKYEDSFVNARNLVSGQLNSKEATEILEDCDYIRYGIGSAGYGLNKDKQLDICNEWNVVKVPYIIITIDKLSDEYFKDLYIKWSKDYTIDGIIVEINNFELREKLGRETNDNPAYARAYKGEFEEIKKTTVNDISWQVSKQGYLKPVAHVEPIKLDGATISNCTLNNAKYVIDLKVGVGSEIMIKRSGQVIPFVVSVLTPGISNIPEKCPSCGNAVQLNETKVELLCTNENCPDKKLNQIISFFRLLEIKNVGEGVCEQLWKAGYKSISDILSLQESDLEKIEGFAKRKAQIVYKSIHEVLQNVKLEKLQHASGCFTNLGSKKLKLLKHFYLLNPTKQDIMKIEGFSEKSAEYYLEGIEKFKEFIKVKPFKIQEDEKPISDKYKHLDVVFTGVRRKDLEEIIIKNGGKISGGVSKNTTHLVMKEKGSGSSKEKKATELGITIMDVKEFESIL